MDSSEGKEEVEKKREKDKERRRREEGREKAESTCEIIKFLQNHQLT